VSAVAVVLAACGDGGSTSSADRGREPGSPNARLELPQDGDVAVVQLATGGGISGPCCEPWSVPEMTVYADGRVVVVDNGAGPVPSLRQVTVEPAKVADLLAHAAEAGLLGDPPPDTGVLCCDLGYTNVTLTDATATHTLSITGLGSEDNANADLTADERDVREAVVDLRDGLENLVREADGTPYVPNELAVYVFAGDESTDGEAPPPWPLPDSLAAGGTPIEPDGRCIHLTTESATVLAAAAARDASGSGDGPATSWSSAGRAWQVTLRPLLPDEHDCP
jgi:hypothetical protein